MARRPQSKALQSLYDCYIGNDSERIESYEAAIADALLAQALYRLRTEAGLTQAELAKRAGTTASVISRLEDADYQGHSLSMVRRIAEAVDHRVEIRFVPEPTGTA